MKEKITLVNRNILITNDDDAAMMWVRNIDTRIICINVTAKVTSSSGEVFISPGIKPAIKINQPFWTQKHDSSYYTIYYYLF